MSRKKVAIIGGGINGFACGVRLLESAEKNSIESVTIFSELFTPYTTGDGSAGLWGPYLMGSTRPEKVLQWSAEMHDFLRRLWLTDKAGEAGICLIPVIRVTTEPSPPQCFWRDVVFGCRQLTDRELDELNSLRTKKFTHGVHFVSFTSEPQKLLPYLMKVFKAAGGRTVQQKVENLREFANNSDYDVIINCTGLGSKELMNDAKMHAIRGQVTRVKAGWMYYVLLDDSDDGNYIIPNSESVVLGGTHQEDDYRTTVCSKDKQFIRTGCEGLVPGLKHAPTLQDWVGLRPGRTEVRIEKEILDDGKVLIHNYGHGGAGVTTSWGCAGEVERLVPKSKI